MLGFALLWFALVVAFLFFPLFLISFQNTVVKEDELIESMARRKYRESRIIGQPACLLCFASSDNSLALLALFTLLVLFFVASLCLSSRCFAHLSFALLCFALLCSLLDAALLSLLCFDFICFRLAE